MQRRGLRELHDELSRRDLLRLAGIGVSGLGLAAIVGCSDDGKGSPTATVPAVDPPPETTTIRLGRSVATCAAPFYLAEQFLPAEGFTNVQYIDEGSIGWPAKLAAGEMDIDLCDPLDVTAAADPGDPELVVLAGLYNSPFVLFGNDRVQSLRDLKGKRVWRPSYPGDGATYRRYGYMVPLLAYIGISPSEVEDVELTVGDALQQFLAGTIDAMAVAEPGPTVLRVNKIGHVVLDGHVDPPWSQYFGGMATGNRDFVEKHPVATKRALRAILKATDVCAREPARAARYFVDKGYSALNYKDTLDELTRLSYAAWREFDPEDTLRFYALRLKEAGIVKSTPDELIARATDWRYLNEIKRELAV